MPAAIAAAPDSARLSRDRLNWLLRFSTGVTAALVVAEAMGWYPTFLPPMLVAVLLANLPGSPPLKTGAALMIVMTAAAWLSLMLPSLLGLSPHIMFGLIAVVIFLAFWAMARGKGGLPALLLLICISIVPVIAMTYPAQASVMPVALVRAMVVTMALVWIMHAIWPQAVPRPAPAAPAPIGNPVAKALGGTLVVMPMILAFLLFGLTDALPVLVTTILLATSFDPKRGAMQGLGFMVGNLTGGMVGVLLFLLLGAAPSLATLAVLTFVAAMAYADRLEKGGPSAAVVLIACNTTLIIFSMLIATGSTSTSVLVTRLMQFALASLFAISMMILIWGGKARLRADR